MAAANVLKPHLPALALPSCTASLHGCRRQQAEAAVQQLLRGGGKDVASTVRSFVVLFLVVGFVATLAMWRTAARV